MTIIDDQIKLAAELLNSGDVDTAERIGHELIATAPQNINVLRLAGAIARKQGRLEESLDYFRRAVALNHRKGLLHFELGTAYTELKRSEEAYECYTKAVQLDPSLQPAYVNLSAIMEQHERYDEAIAWAEKAIALKPDCGLSYYNVANAQRELGQLDAAIENYSRALEFKPDRAKTLWNLGICHLLAGNFRKGWPLFEQRQDAQEVFFDRYTQPRWDGSSLAGKTIVVHAEQGIGDEILFASCFPDLLPLAKRCIFVCDPRLEKLLTRSFPQAGAYGHLRRKDWSPPAIPEPFDVQIPAGSLPLYFRTSPDGFPQRERFLDVDPTLLSMWRERLEALGPGLKIGISWRAGGKPAESRKRTIPLDRWAGILATPKTHVINLQYGDATADIAATESLFGVKVHDWEQGDPLVDIDSFAAKIAALDLVISVGNATVHIAGAVGTEAWALLPKVPSWRWMISGEQSPWYGCVRLFRQQAGGDWQPVLSRIESMLRERVGPHAAKPAMRDLPERCQSATFSTADSQNRRWFGPAELAGHKSDQLVAKSLEEAKTAEQYGDLALAERKYREALQFAPRHYEALNGLGVVARKTGRTDLAIRSFQRSLAMIDALPVHQFNLADALADAGRFDQALEHYRRGMKLDPTNAVAHIQSGRMLNRQGRPKDALDEFDQALNLAPANEAALVERAQAFKSLCRIDEAIEHLEEAIQLRSDSAILFAALGSMYFDEQRFAEAIERLRQATAIDPSFISALVQLSLALESVGRLEDAASTFERVVALEKNDFAAIMRLAKLRAQLGELESAADLLRRALALRPANAPVLLALADVLWQLESTDDALDCLDDAVQFAPNSPEAHLNRGYALLRVGRFAEGWQELEWPRIRKRGGAFNALDNGTRSVPYAEWDGSSLEDKTVLIGHAADLSDQVMFASCFPDIIEKAARCVIACDPRFERLLRRSFPQAHVAAAPRGGRQVEHLPAGLRVDVQVEAGSLPRFLRPSAGSFSKRSAYLTAESAAVEVHRREIANLGDGPKIGIATARTGSLVNLASDVKHTLGSVDRATLVPLPGESNSLDIDDLTTRLAALDLVVSDGGLVAHLAGALGVPCWILLADHSDWRWIGGETATIWYPQVRLFRARRMRLIDAVERLRAELLNWVAQNDDKKRMTAVRAPHFVPVPVAQIPPIFAPPLLN
ncbi:MAG TPA: tetratricopeptide repeat protein [Pirellulales bacterium]|nr:tetratricopeptide repeat protein [Pirellulales bacterium]